MADHDNEAEALEEDISAVPQFSTGISALLFGENVMTYSTVKKSDTSLHLISSQSGL